MGRRRQARELAIQLLYLLDLNPRDPDEARRLFWEDRPVPDVVRDFADEIVDGVSADREEIDGWIRRVARNWDLERLAAVDRAILRAAVYELLYREDIPAVVTINEAVELAKAFSTAESGRFVNGMLDAVRKGLETSGSPAASDPDGAS